MSKSRSAASPRAALRRRADDQLKAHNADRSVEKPKDPQALLHELEVHQIELAMQNEELVRARNDLEIGLKRYRELFDFAPIGYVVLDGSGGMRELNLAAARLLGLERQRLVGKLFLAFVAEVQRTRFADFFDRVLMSVGHEHKPTESCELTICGAGAEPREVRLTGVLFEGSIKAALFAIEDVTARKRAEIALREEGKRKDEFLAILSHELRNPLAPIRNSLYLLERTEPGGDEARQAQAVIDRQISHLARIVDDLLDVTRIARGKVQLRREKVSLCGLTKSAAEDHRSSFEASGIKLTTNFGMEALWVDADPTRLSQVLGNLLGNAVKFTPRGGSVEVVVRREGRMAVLSVRDTGMGIPPEMRDRLFQPFSQGPQSLDRARGGLGLGLAMVKGLIELHGGVVAASSKGLGCGSEFTVRLPIAQAPTPVKTPIERREHKRCRVLIIEDNQDAAESLRALLTHFGHQVYLAHDGPAGLEQVAALRPDVVLCDIGLPSMDGYEVARAIRRNEELKGVYLVALTGYARPEDVQRVADAGFDRHLRKPLSLAILQQVLADAPCASPSGEGAERGVKEAKV